MATVTIRIPTPLRTYTGGADEVSVEASNVEQALQALAQRHEGILEQVLNPDEGIRRFVNVYVGDRNVNSLEGLDTPVQQEAVISIVPAVAGGRS